MPFRLLKEKLYSVSKATVFKIRDFTITINIAF